MEHTIRKADQHQQPASRRITAEVSKRTCQLQIELVLQSCDGRHALLEDVHVRTTHLRSRLISAQTLRSGRQSHWLAALRQRSNSVRCRLWRAFSRFWGNLGDKLGVATVRGSSHSRTITGHNHLINQRLRVALQLLRHIPLVSADGRQLCSNLTIQFRRVHQLNRTFARSIAQRHSQTRLRPFEIDVVGWVIHIERNRLIRLDLLFQRKRKAQLDQRNRTSIRLTAPAGNIFSNRRFVFITDQPVVVKSHLDHLHGGFKRLGEVDLRLTVITKGEEAVFAQTLNVDLGQFR